jgi:hypothetical protein
MSQTSSAIPMRAFRSAITSALLLTLWAGGCARAQDGASALPEAAERRAAGIVVREVARSGVDTLFQQVTGVDVDSRGRVYVGDWFASRVAVLDSTGALVATMGRRGLGPGEFRSIRGVQVLPGDSLLVYDPSAARLSVFAPGAAAPAYVLNVGAASAPPFLIHRTRANDAFVAMFRPTFRGDDTARATERLRVLGLDGRPRGEPLRAYPARGFLRVSGPDGFAVTPDPFGSEGLYAVGADDRIHYLWSDSLAVETTDLEGRRAGGFSVRYRSPRVQREDVASEIAGMPPQMMEVFRRALEDSLPERWPAARALLADPDGRLWIGLHTPAGEPREWAVFTAGGRYLGSVFLPRESELHAVRGRRLYTVQKDADDVPHVVVYRMDAQPG